MDVRVGPWRKLSTEELMLLNCGVGEDTWESLGLQGDPTNHPKGDQSWVFIGRTDAKAKTPIIWPPHAKSWLIVKDSDAGKDWRQEEKGMTEDEMVRWHHRLNGHEFEETPGVGDGQGSLACCSSWGHKESDETEWLNWYWYWSAHHSQNSIPYPGGVKAAFPFPPWRLESCVTVSHPSTCLLPKQCDNTSISNQYLIHQYLIFLQEQETWLPTRHMANLFKNFN